MCKEFKGAGKMELSQGPDEPMSRLAYFDAVVVEVLIRLGR